MDQPLPPIQPIIPQIPIVESVPAVVKPPFPNWPIYILIFLFGIASVLAYQKYLPAGFNPAAPSPLVSPKLEVKVDDPTVDWKTYKIDQLNLEFKLPQKLNNQDWETKIIPGDTGDNICFHLKNPISFIPQAHAGGVGLCNFSPFLINSVSSDFTAGRGGAFTDISGYALRNNQVYVHKKTPATNPIPEELVKIITNHFSVEIIRTLGRDERLGEWNGPVVGTPGEGYIGALINTNNLQHPGITVTMKLDSNLTPDLFDLILSTFRFTDSSEVSVPVDKITDQEIQQSWYWGDSAQKKPGTPADWVFQEAGRSSCWHKPNVSCTFK